MTGGVTPRGLVPAVALALAVAARAPLAAQVDGTLAVGDSVRDSLTAQSRRLPAERTYAREWGFRGAAGETVTIDVASDAFDAYVFLLGPGFDATPPQDDDSGGRCNARLAVRLPQSGDYIIVVTSTDQDAIGPFTLGLRAGVRPPGLAPCRR